MNTMLAFAMGQATCNEKLMIFDWMEAAKIILDRNAEYAEAGLAGDWGYTGGTIWNNHNIDVDSYTYLASTWAIPSIKINDEYIPCFVYEGETEYDAHTKWPTDALSVIESLKSS
jgi:hypothetical protein